MGKKKEGIEAEKKREIVRQLRKGPDLEQYVEGKKRKFTTYFLQLKILLDAGFFILQVQ